MFANYPRHVIPSLPLIKFDFVEEKRHPDLALMGEVLEDIKKRTSGLIAERNRLMAEKARLEERVNELESELTSCKEEQAQRVAAPPTITPPVPSNNPAVGERIRALVEEIDACIALMPRSRHRASAEIVSA
jgi:sugar-specific transcriptional regulator TrmB